MRTLLNLCNFKNVFWSIVSQLKRFTAVFFVQLPARFYVYISLPLPPLTLISLIINKFKISDSWGRQIEKKFWLGIPEFWTRKPFMISKTEKQSLTFFERKEMIFFIIAKDIAFWNVLKVSDSQKKILVSSKKQLNQKKKE